MMQYDGLTQNHNLTFTMNNGDDFVVANVGETQTIFAGRIKTETFFNGSNNIEFNEVVDMLIDAVNNRTRERNYFKKYSELLEETITEDEFDSEIEKNEDDYVVGSHIKPTPRQLQHALKLIQRIKDVESTEDLSSLFSFNTSFINNLALK